MLVLTRKPLESIVISNNIVVTVLSVLGRKVKLGIQAPRSVLINRTELMEAIQESPEKTVECDPPLYTSRP